MKHGQEQPSWYDEDDPELWWGLSTPMEEFLLLERALCSCEASCECDWEEMWL